MRFESETVPLPMEIMKENEHHIQLKCMCMHTFWSPRSGTSRCPSCGTVWNGQSILYVAVRVRLHRLDDYTTIILLKHNNIAYCMKAFLADEYIAGFVMANGVIFEAISKEDYLAYDQNKVSVDCASYLNRVGTLASSIS